MPGIFTDYWRIIKPASTKSQYVTSSTEAAKLYSNFSWYTRVMKGANSRFSKYTQYKNMDTDVFVSRALDTVAEEMTSENTITGLPFEIEYQNESNTEIPENVTMTVRAALRHWCDVQDFSNNLFDVARTTIKFGDCFFRKTSDLKKWLWVDSGDIIGVSINDDGKPEHYHVRTGEKNREGAFGDVQLVPAAGIVHFTLSSSMGENGPFGESVLWACVKAYRHLTLLEDSVIIYRIVRAPERRVFFIDVGNMPPQRQKAYLESVKNDIRQKRIPNDVGGTDKIDSVYNPMSMTEDFFFAQTAEGRGSRVETLSGGECLALDTKIKLLDGRDVELSQLITEHAEGRENWVYSCNPTTGAFAPGKITWAGVTRRDTQVIRFTLDNGESFTVTPDHRFPIKGLGKVEAQDLTVGQSMIPLYTREASVGNFSGHSKKKAGSYTQLFDNVDGKWKFVHREVSKFVHDTVYDNTFKHDPDHQEPLTTVHHLDFDRYNNNPHNLARMGSRDHWKYHAAHVIDSGMTFKAQERFQWLRENDPAAYAKIIAAQQDGLKRWRDSLTPEQYAAHCEKLSTSIKKYFQTIDDHQRKVHAERSRANFKKGTEALRVLLQSEDFNVEYGSRISMGQARSKLLSPELWEQRGKKISAAALERWSDQEYLEAGRTRATKQFNAYMQANPEGFAERNRLVSVSRTYVYDDFICNRVKLIIRDAESRYVQRDEVLSKMNGDQELLDHYRKLNRVQLESVDRSIDRFTESSLQGIASYLGMKGWKELRYSVTDVTSSYQNHKIVKIEWLDEKIDTGTITVDGFEELHGYHTFALSCGVYTFNSLGEIGDLNYFQNKFLQGLRIPSSYMRGGSDGGIAISDGKVGVAYVEELRFANYVARLQKKIVSRFDLEFKCYLKSAGINVDPQIFKLKLPDPQNFEDYKRAEVDEKMLGNYGNVKDVKTISERMKQRYYLGWTEDQIQENEALLKQELGIPEGGIDDTLTDTRMLYDPKWIEDRPDIKVPDSFDDHTGATGEEEATAPPVEGEEGTEAPSEEKPGNKSEQSEKETAPKDLDDIGDEIEKL